MYKVTTKDGFATYSDNVEGITLTVPEKNYSGIVKPQPMPEIEDACEIEKSVLNPVSGKRLKDIAFEKNAKSACILVSDATRCVPTATVAEFLVEELTKGGVPFESITFFVALGVHRDATPEEMRSFVGDNLYGRVKIENHTPYSYDNLVYLGDTPRKTPVEVNKRAYECDIHVLVGKVEPHDMAGFSGGRKSVLPGVSSEKTIKINHRPEMMFDENCLTGVLEGNPIHEDMLDTAKMFGIDSGVNFVLNGNQEISSVFSGGLEESHAAAVAYLRKFCSAEIDKADIYVVCPGKPFDIDFYQSLKAVFALTEVLDETSTLVIYSESAEGVSSPDMLFAFNKSDDIDEVMDYIVNNYEIQMDHAILLSKIIKKGVKLVGYSPNVSAEEFKTMRMTACESPDKIMETAFKVCGKPDAKVLFFPCPQKRITELK